MVFRVMIIDPRQASWVDQHTGKVETIICFLDISEFQLWSLTTLSIGFWDINYICYNCNRSWRLLNFLKCVGVENNCCIFDALNPYRWGSWADQQWTNSFNVLCSLFPKKARVAERTQAWTIISLKLRRMKSCQEQF